jgi:hypothetical protein
MSFYFIISQTQRNQMQGYKDGVNQFNAVQDLQGRWVCDVNSLAEFENLFAGVTVTLVQLSNVDFPKTNSIIT